MVFGAILSDFSKKMQWSKPCQNCQNIHGNLVCLIFLSCRVLVKHGKKIRGITHTKQGAKLFMDRIWSLYFRLLLYEITSFVILFPNFYCHNYYNLLDLFSHQKTKIPEVFQWSWTFPWRKKRRDCNLRKTAFCTKSLKVNLERRSLLVASAPAKLNCG